MTDPLLRSGSSAPPPQVSPRVLEKSPAKTPGALLVSQHNNPIPLPSLLSSTQPIPMLEISIPRPDSTQVSRRINYFKTELDAELPGGGKMIVPNLVMGGQEPMIDLTSLKENINTYFPGERPDKTAIINALATITTPTATATNILTALDVDTIFLNEVYEYLSSSLGLLTSITAPGTASVTIAEFKDMVDAIGGNTQNSDIVSLLGLLYPHAKPELKRVIEDSLISGHLTGNEVRLSLYEDDGHTAFFLKDLATKWHALPPELSTKLCQKWILTNVIGSQDGDPTGFTRRSLAAYGADLRSQRAGLDELSEEVKFLIPEPVTGLVNEGNLTPQGAYLVSIYQTLSAENQAENEIRDQINQRLIEAYQPDPLPEERLHAPAAYATNLSQGFTVNMTPSQANSIIDERIAALAAAEEAQLSAAAPTMPAVDLLQPPPIDVSSAVIPSPTSLALSSSSVVSPVTPPSPLGQVNASPPPNPLTGNQAKPPSTSEVLLPNPDTDGTTATLSTLTPNPNSAPPPVDLALPTSSVSPSPTDSTAAASDSAEPIANLTPPHEDATSLLPCTSSIPSSLTLPPPIPVLSLPSTSEAPQPNPEVVISSGVTVTPLGAASSSAIPSSLPLPPPNLTGTDETPLAPSPVAPTPANTPRRQQYFPGRGATADFKAFDGIPEKKPRAEEEIRSKEAPPALRGTTRGLPRVEIQPLPPSIKQKMDQWKLETQQRELEALQGELEFQQEKLSELIGQMPPGGTERLSALLHLQVRVLPENIQTVNPETVSRQNLPQLTQNLRIVNQSLEAALSATPQSLTPQSSRPQALPNAAEIPREIASFWFFKTLPQEKEDEYLNLALQTYDQYVALQDQGQASPFNPNILCMHFALLLMQLDSGRASENLKQAAGDLKTKAIDFLVRFYLTNNNNCTETLWFQDLYHFLMPECELYIQFAARCKQENQPPSLGEQIIEINTLYQYVTTELIFSRNNIPPSLYTMSSQTSRFDSIVQNIQKHRNEKTSFSIQELTFLLACGLGADLSKKVGGQTFREALDSYIQNCGLPQDDWSGDYQTFYMVYLLYTKCSSNNALVLNTGTIEELADRINAIISTQQSKLATTQQIRINYFEKHDYSGLALTDFEQLYGLSLDYAKELIRQNAITVEFFDRFSDHGLCFLQKLYDQEIKDKREGEHGWALSRFHDPASSAEILARLVSHEANAKEKAKFMLRMLHTTLKADNAFHGGFIQKSQLAMPRAMLRASKDSIMASINEPPGRGKTTLGGIFTDLCPTRQAAILHQAPFVDAGHYRIRTILDLMPILTAAPQAEPIDLYFTADDFREYILPILQNLAALDPAQLSLLQTQILSLFRESLSILDEADSVVYRETSRPAAPYYYQDLFKQGFCHMMLMSATFNRATMQRRLDRNRDRLLGLQSSRQTEEKVRDFDAKIKKLDKTIEYEKSRLTAISPKQKTLAALSSLATDILTTSRANQRDNRFLMIFPELSIDELLTQIKRIHNFNQMHLVYYDAEGRLMHKSPDQQQPEEIENIESLYGLNDHPVVCLYAKERAAGGDYADLSLHQVGKVYLGYSKVPTAQMFCQHASRKRISDPRVDQAIERNSALILDPAEPEIQLYHLASAEADPIEDEKFASIPAFQAELDVRREAQDAVDEIQAIETKILEKRKKLVQLMVLEKCKSLESQKIEITQNIPQQYRSYFPGGIVTIATIEEAQANINASTLKAIDKERAFLALQEVRNQLQLLEEIQEQINQGIQREVNAALNSAISAGQKPEDLAKTIMRNISLQLESALTDPPEFAPNSLENQKIAICQALESKNLTLGALQQRMDSGATLMEKWKNCWLQLQPELLAQLPAQFLDQLQTQFLVKLQTQLLAQLPAQFLADLQTQLPAEFQVQLIAQLLAQFLAQLQLQPSAQLPVEVLTQLQVHLQAQFLTQLPAEFPTQFQTYLQTHLSAEQLAQLQAQFLTQLPAEFLTQFQGNPPAERAAQVAAELTARLQGQEQFWAEEILLGGHIPTIPRSLSVEPKETQKLGGSPSSSASMARKFLSGFRLREPEGTKEITPRLQSLYQGFQTMRETYFGFKRQILATMTKFSATVAAPLSQTTPEIVEVRASLRFYAGKRVELGHHLPSTSVPYLSEGSGSGASVPPRKEIAIPVVNLTLEDLSLTPPPPAVLASSSSQSATITPSDALPLASQSTPTLSTPRQEEEQTPPPDGTPIVSIGLSGIASPSQTPPPPHTPPVVPPLALQTPPQHTQPVVPPLPLTTPSPHTPQARFTPKGVAKSTRRIPGSGKASGTPVVNTSLTPASTQSTTPRRKTPRSSGASGTPVVNTSLTSASTQSTPPKGRTPRSMLESTSAATYTAAHKSRVTPHRRGSERAAS